MAFDNSQISLAELEQLEYKYLLKYWYFLKFVEDEMVQEIQSMNEIREDWEGLYGGAKGSSQFDVGCERIVYALLNGKIAGKPNSNPVSSDLFFEVEDAFIHIDLKTVTTSEGIGTDNIRDFNTSITVEKNQNSYRGIIKKTTGRSVKYNPNLPTFYTKINGDKKVTLTYFVCLLNSSVTLKPEIISIVCMPNGRLVDQYGSRPLRAGKNPDEARFNFKEAPTFELLEGNKKRVRIIHKDSNMSAYLIDKLSFYLENFDPEIAE